MKFKLPPLGEGVYEAELVRWLVEPGQAVTPGVPLLEVMTDKATMEVPSPFQGIIENISGKPGDRVRLDQEVLEFSQVGNEAMEKPMSGAQEEPNWQNQPLQPCALENGREGKIGVKAGPAVRFLARKIGVELSEIAATGPQGRVLAEDLARHVQAQARPREPGAKAPLPSMNDFGKPGKKIPYQGIRRAIGEKMEMSIKALPQCTFVEECEVTDLVKARERLNRLWEHETGHLTFLPFFIKAAAIALRDVPLANARMEENGNTIHCLESCHIGFAASVPSGLVVPVVLDADKKPFVEIAQEVNALTRAARENKLTPEQLRDGTFSISSMGSLGGIISTPIINYPQSAILGLGKIVRKPVYGSTGALRPGDFIFLSLTFDHRVMDGAGAAAFSRSFATALNWPEKMLLPIPGHYPEIH